MPTAHPAEKWDLEPFYFKGLAGRGPVKAEIEKHYSEKTPNYKCAEHEDFRVLLDKEKSIDAILCATPDHLHAYVSAYCMRNGKHVYRSEENTSEVQSPYVIAYA